MLEALAEVSSAILVPDDWCEPLAPLMQMAGRRSTLPSDLSPEQPALLVDLVSPVDQPVLTARVRSRLAHGLITDAEAWSASTVYAWWLALRLVVSSFWTTREPAQQV